MARFQIPGLSWPEHPLPWQVPPSGWPVVLPPYPEWIQPQTLPQITIPGVDIAQPASVRVAVTDRAYSLVGVGRDTNESQLSEITEGRYTYVGKGGVRYAWCGDFVTYVYARTGCTRGDALNRVELNGSWTPGDNIARLWRWGKSQKALVSPVDAAPGDAICIPRTGGDHVAIIGSTANDEFELVNGNGHMGRVSLSRRKKSAQTRWILNVSSLFYGVDLPDTVPTRKFVPERQPGEPVFIETPFFGASASDIPRPGSDSDKRQMMRERVLSLMACHYLCK